MAILGGGPGGGGPVGSGNSFTGTAQSLELVGSHCYAYSGAIAAASGAGQDYLDFQTGNYYVVARVQWFYLAAASNDVNYRHYMNENEIVNYIVSDNPGNSEPDNWLTIIIPPYTRFRTNAQGSQQQMCVLTGTVYRD